MKTGATSSEKSAILQEIYFRTHEPADADDEDDEDGDEEGGRAAGSQRRSVGVTHV